MTCALARPCMIVAARSSCLTTKLAHYLDYFRCSSNRLQSGSAVCVYASDGRLRIRCLPFRRSGAGRCGRTIPAWIRDLAAGDALWWVPRWAPAYRALARPSRRTSCGPTRRRGARARRIRAPSPDAPEPMREQHPPDLGLQSADSIYLQFTTASKLGSQSASAFSSTPRASAYQHVSKCLRFQFTTASKLGSTRPKVPPPSVHHREQGRINTSKSVFAFSSPPPASSDQHVPKCLHLQFNTASKRGSTRPKVSLLSVNPQRASSDRHVSKCLRLQVGKILADAAPSGRSPRTTPPGRSPRGQPIRPNAETRMEATWPRSPWGGGAPTVLPTRVCARRAAEGRPRRVAGRAAR